MIDEKKTFIALPRGLPSIALNPARRAARCRCFHRPRRDSVANSLDADWHDDLPYSNRPITNSQRHAQRDRFLVFFTNAAESRLPPQRQLDCRRG